MKNIVKQPEPAFRGLMRPGRDLMKRAAAFTRRPVRPSRHRIGCPFPGNRIVGHGGIRRIRSGRTRPNLVWLWPIGYCDSVTLYATRGIITQT